MKIAILTLGTRGDVRPYVALGAGLKQAGNEVTLVTAKGFDELVAGRGLRYVALDLDLLELARSPEGKAALRSARGAWRLLRQLLPAWRQMLVDEWEAARSAEAIVYHPNALGGFHIAEALGVPGFLVLPVPALSPTRAFPTPVLPLPNLGGPLNRLSYGLFFRSSTAPYRRMINRWREHTLGLAPLSLLASELERDGEPVTKLYCCSQRDRPAHAAPAHHQALLPGGSQVPAVQEPVEDRVEVGCGEEPGETHQDYRRVDQSGEEKAAEFSRGGRKATKINSGEISMLGRPGTKPITRPPRTSKIG